MKLSDLKKNYHQFARPTFTIILDGKPIYPGNIVLKSIHVDVTYDVKANIAEVVFTHDIPEKKLQTDLHNGACMIIKGGYQGKEDVIFQGYLQSIQVSRKCDLHSSTLTLYAQDVKGLMMLHKQRGIVKGKTKGAMIQDILKTDLYCSYYAKTTFTALQHVLDTPYYSSGKSDYEILCTLCTQLFYAFYVDRDTLYVTPRYQKTNRIIEFDVPEDIYEITTRYTIQDLIGHITVQTCDGYEKKKNVKEKVSITSFPYASALTSIQSHTHVVYTDDGFHDMEELQYISRMMKQEIETSYGHVYGQCVFLPDLSCAACLQYKDEHGAVKSGFIVHVTHHMDADQLYSEWEAVMQKGS